MVLGVYCPFSTTSLVAWPGNKSVNIQTPLDRLGLKTGAAHLFLFLSFFPLVERFNTMVWKDTFPLIVLTPLTLVPANSLQTKWLRSWQDPHKHPWPWNFSILGWSDNCKCYRQDCHVQVHEVMQITNGYRTDLFHFGPGSCFLLIDWTTFKTYHLLPRTAYKKRWRFCMENTLLGLYWTVYKGKAKVPQCRELLTHKNSPSSVSRSSCPLQQCSVSSCIDLRLAACYKRLTRMYWIFYLIDCIEY